MGPSIRSPDAALPRPPEHSLAWLPPPWPCGSRLVHGFFSSSYPLMLGRPRGHLWGDRNLLLPRLNTTHRLQTPPPAPAPNPSWTSPQAVE